MEPWLGVRKWGAKFVQHVCSHGRARRYGSQAAAASGVDGVMDMLPFIDPLTNVKSLTIRLDDTGLVDRCATVTLQ